MCPTAPPKFESFSTLLYKMQDFMEENPEYRYLNTQSVDIKFKSIDELHTYYMVYINDIGYYLRILRLVCTKQSVVRHKPLEREITFDNSCHPNEIKPDSDESKSRAIETDKKPSSDTKVLANDRPVFNIETHYFEIMQNNNALHGPFYPVKRAIEEFMERPEWFARDERRPENRWKYLCSETITVLAKDELDIEKRVEMSLFSNRQSVFILMPRIYNIIRIYFDTSDVIPNRDYKSSNKALKKCQSQSFDKKFKTISFRQQSLPVSAIQYIDSTNESLKTIKEKITKSFICSLM